MNKRAYFAGGCFWCTEAIFLKINGVDNVSPIYVGGETENPTYEEVCTGLTGHAEGVEIQYNSRVIDYRSLVLLFFSTHDPTTLNRQGNEIVFQYRSIIFYQNSNEKEILKK